MSDEQQPAGSDGGDPPSSDPPAPSALPASQPKTRRQRRTKQKPKGSRQRAESAYDSTDLEERFAYAWWECRNLSEAAKRAGAKGKTVHALRQAGFRLYHLPVVQALLADLKKEAEDRANLTRATILDELFTNVQQARRDKQYAPSNRALELLGKELHGMFIDKVDVRVQGAVEDIFETVLSQMKPEARAEFLKAYQKAMAVAGVDSTPAAADPAADDSD